MHMVSADIDENVATDINEARNQSANSRIQSLTAQNVIQRTSLLMLEYTRLHSE